MNPFRNFSIKTRLFSTFILVTLFPVIVFLYIQLSGISISNATGIFLAALSMLIAVFTAFLVTASIVAPVAKISHALQTFRIKKSAVTVYDNHDDELGNISAELTDVFAEFSTKVVTLGKRQFQQEKEQEKTEYRLSIAGKELSLIRSCLSVAQELNTTFDFQSNLKTILDEAVRTMNIQWASVLLVNRDNLEMTVACVRGIEQSLLDDLTEDEYPTIRLKPHEGLAGSVIREELPLIANKGHKDPRFKQFSEFRDKDEKVASILCSPIKGSDGKILGVMNFVNRINPPVFRSEDLPYSGDLCKLVTLVIERNRLYKNLFQDDKTGLSAYNVWKGYYEEETSRAIRYAQPLSLVIVDIDNFKGLVADTSSEFVADIIEKSGKIIQDALRDIDIGSNVQDRFYLLLPNTDTAGGVFFVGRIKETLEQQKFEFDSKEFNITISAGIGNYPDSANDARQLSVCAISALNKAKKQGTGRTIVFSPEQV